MTYVDGFVLTIKKGKLPDYKKMATGAAKIWKKHGALGYYECVGDDLNPYPKNTPPECIGVTFPQLTKPKAGEHIIFAFIIYKNKKHRDSVNKKVMTDPAMNEWANKPMPFDMKRMTYGGFQTIVEATQ